MSQVIRARPFQVFDDATSRGFSLRHFSIPSPTDRDAPRAWIGHVFVSSRLNRLKTAVRTGGVKPLWTLGRAAICADA